VLVALAATPRVAAQDTRPAESRLPAESPRERSEWTRWDVGGIAREGLVYRSTAPGRPAPLVLAFHGHGGSARQAARSFRFHEHWPEAIVAYLEGLPTPTRRIDPDGRLSGWQVYPGHQDDRDLRFVDVVLAALKVRKAVDEDRVFATGHSNGGAFTYLLWARRPEAFAAFAPSAAGSVFVATIPAKPAMHLAGRNDELVRFEAQERTMLAVRYRNGCEGPARRRAEGCLEYPSPKGAPFVSFIHDGGHRYPAEATPLVVAFFKEHARPKAESRPDPK
jgi:polyhydroxybutyrate depolymerase